MLNSAHRDTYLVILKVYGNAIHLWSPEKIKLLNSKSHSLRISCLSSEQDRSSIQTSIIKELIEKENSDSNSEYNDENEEQKCQFREQSKYGERIGSSDLIMFMTEPIDNLEKISFTIDLNMFSNRAKIINNSMEDFNVDVDRKVGQAYVYLEHKFSSQGFQRTSILDSNHVQTGQLEVNYLIVTNPIAFGVKGLKPDWMYASQLDAGHRGAGVGNRKDLPNGLLENTIASFNFAHRNGADLCELDVVLSADGIPVVYHDFDVDTKQTDQDELGKNRRQVSEFTLEQIRNFCSLSMNDEQGNPFTVDIKSLDIKNRPFPTLSEVLNEVEGGLNIELKWPQLLENRKMQARKYCEINKFVEKVIEVIDLHERDVREKHFRPILLSTFDVDIAILLRLKQTKYPVSFLTTADSSRFNDPITKTIKNATHFAEAFDLTGVNANAAKVTGKLVKYAHDRGLLFYAWGKIESAQAIQELKRTGLNGVIYDKIDLIKPNSTP